MKHLGFVGLFEYSHPCLDYLCLEPLPPRRNNGSAGLGKRSDSGKLLSNPPTRLRVHALQITPAASTRVNHT
jgi:hypothetical protein